MTKSVRRRTLALALAAGLLGAGAAYTQLFFRGSGDDYNTTGVDAQRTNWVRNDRFIAKDDFSKGGFKLQWKVAIEKNVPRQLSAVIGGTTSGGGLNKPLNVILTPNNTLTTIDDDTGVRGWTRHFDAALPASSTLACPGGLTANASRPVTLAQAAPAGARGAAAAPGGRAPVGYMSIVSEPGAGLPASVTTRGGFGAPPPARAGAPAGAPGATPPARSGNDAAAFGGFGRGAAPTYKTPFGGGRFGSGGGFYIVTSDGVLRTVGDGSGKELQPPIPFLPANARVSSLTAVPENNDQWHSYVIYAATVNGCGGAPNRVWAINLADDAKPITHVDTGASVVGDPAFSTNGTVYVAVGKGPAGAAHSNAILALEPKTLKVKDWFTDAQADFASTPMIVKSGDKEIVVEATRDGRVYLLDADSLGGSDHGKALFVSPAYSSTKTDFAPAAMAGWQEEDGTTYVALPFSGAGPSGLNATVTHGGILTLKLTSGNAGYSLAPAWVSPDMTSPLAPLVVNGVMFALSSGEFHPAKGSAMTGALRAKQSVPAELFALDSASGQPFWNSGSTIPSFVAGTPLWIGGGQVYLATFNSEVYSFGFAEERYPTP